MTPNPSAQVHATITASAPVEYEGPEHIARRFGIGRSTVFELLRAGKIKSFSLKTRAGNLRGRRLVSIAAARSFFESLTTTN